MEIHFNKIEEYLYVKVKGKYTKDEKTKILKKISNKCIQDDYFRILVDLTDVQLDADVYERYLFGKEFALFFGGNIGKYMKIALFAQPKKIEDVDLKFEETVARNRDLDLMVFPNESNAIKWLLNKSYQP